MSNCTFLSTFLLGSLCSSILPFSGQKDLALLWQDELHDYKHPPQRIRHISVYLYIIYIYIDLFVYKKLPGSKVNKESTVTTNLLPEHILKVHQFLTPLWLRTTTASNKSMSSYNNENTSSCFGQKRLAYRTSKKSDNTIQTCVTIGWVRTVLGCRWGVGGRGWSLLR